MINKTLTLILLSTSLNIQAAIVSFDFSGTGAGGQPVDGTFSYDESLLEGFDIFVAISQAQLDTIDFSFSVSLYNNQINGPFSYFSVTGPGNRLDAIYINGGGVILNLEQLTSTPTGYLESTGADSGAISGLQVNQVPIAPSAWLFGSALIGLAGIQRRGVTGQTKN
jgi:hypothetical protein